LKGLEDHAGSIMDTGIDGLVKELLAEYKGKSDAGRKNELSIELKFALKKVANRIDRGFNIEVRMEEPTMPAEADEEADDKVKALAKSHERIQAASENLQFLKLDGDPILQLAESKDEKAK
jgi:hypothetical protein